MGELTDLVEKYDDYCKQKIVEELKIERDKLLPKYRDGEVDEYNRGANDMLEEIIEHIDNRILEPKGENNEIYN